MLLSSTQQGLIPSLTFTKAELVYIVSVLTADIPPSDNKTHLEMVELRHYLNQIKDKVAHAASDGTLGRSLAASKQEEGEHPTPPKKTAPMPSMSELKQKFPTLTEDEIKEVLAKAKTEREKAEAERKKNEPPPPPSFIAKPPLPSIEPSPESVCPISSKPLTEEQEKKRENSRKFASMLGSF